MTIQEEIMDRLEKDLKQVNSRIDDFLMMRQDIIKAIKQQKEDAILSEITKDWLKKEVERQNQIYE